ncbi:MAG: DNA repair protein RecO [Flavobacteriales bacterium]|nr:DNA repair protein RecO [Flavobacteriales bacterium]
MRSKSEAIVLHHFEYSDRAWIARVFTRTHGYLSFIVRKSGKNKHQSLIQSGTLLELEFTFRENQDLHQISEMRRAVPWVSVTESITKSTQVLFLCEVLFRSLEIGYTNKDLFDFIWLAFSYLDQCDEYPDFHLYFMIRLSGHLGFFPQNAQDPEAAYFDLENGMFTTARPIHPLHLEPELAAVLRQLIERKVQQDHPPLKASYRRSALHALVDYFKLHVSGIKEVNSQLVLETIFHD